MKKLFFLPLFLISLFAYVNNVNADTIDIHLPGYFDLYPTWEADTNEIGSDFDLLLTYYEEELAEDYPYFLVNGTNWQGVYSYTVFYFEIAPSSTNVYRGSVGTGDETGEALYLDIHPDGQLYMFQDNVLDVPSDGSYSLFPWYTDPSISRVDYRPILSSNFNLSITQIYTVGDTSSPLNAMISFPTYIIGPDEYTDPFVLRPGDYIPTYDEIFSGEYVPSDHYVEVNLNDYAYVILSLNSYNIDPFVSTVMVQGQFCPTAVYSYGMKEKSSVMPGYIQQRCTPVHDTFSPVYFDVIESDVKNNAVYYIKAYDLTITNKMKFDSDRFSITYITQENADDPSVSIGGRSYPVIPYSSLTSTSTQSEAENYVSGEVKNVFDVSSDSSFVSNLFSNPLETLGNVWTSIITMFSLVGSFIALLPTTLQAFLYSAFSIGIVLGVIKILL